MWFMALLLTAFVAGCGGSSSGSPAPSSAKAITAYSLAWIGGAPGTLGAAPGTATGTINETLKTIAVSVPFGTDVTTMKATFTSTTGDIVTVGSVTQKSDTTVNDFSGSVAYKVTAVDSTWATYTVIVTPITVTSIAVTPPSFSIPAGGTHQFIATATYSNSTTSVVTTNNSTTNATTNWTPDISGNATVGLHTGLAVGVTTSTTPVVITATFGGQSGTAALTVTPATLTSIAVTPASAVVAVGGTEQFVATGTYSDLTNHAVTTTASWTSAASGVASVGPTTGLATGLAIGTSDITATLSGQTSTAALTVTAVAGPVVCGGASGTNCVNLGTAANYVILDQATVTFTPITTITTTPTITGNIGLSPAAASFLIGFPTSPPLDSSLCFSTSHQVTGKLYAANYQASSGCTAVPDTKTLLTTAVNDENFAYGFAAGKATAGGGLTYQACPGATGAMSDVNDALAAGGSFPVTGLPAGVYTCGATAISIPGTLTLHGSATDVWVFQTAGGLSEAVSTNVVLTGGALPQNVFWQAAGGVNIGAGAHMEGVVLSATNIQLITGATVNGRLFGITGVLMDSNTVTQP